MIIVDQLAAVDDLPLPLAVERIENRLGVGREMGRKRLAIQQRQRIQHSRRLFRAILAGNGAQRILGGLRPIIARNQHREGRIVRRFVGEVSIQTDAANVVDEIAKVQRFIG